MPPETNSNRIVSQPTSMNVILASHYGMCFGVRDALKATHLAAKESSVTILGQLVHNEVVNERLTAQGVQHGDLHNVDGASTSSVVITAHGAADKDRTNWQQQGYRVVDTTCPLVRKAHTALATLVAKGAHPVVIGKRDHVEVRGLTGDFPGATVVFHEDDLASLPKHAHYGVVSQTTQPIDFVCSLVKTMMERHPDREFEFVDTVCQPTKDRQKALKDLCQQVDVVIVVGGNNSNNTHRLASTAESYGVRAHRVSRAADIEPDWLRNVTRVGVTAGTSTLKETVDEVCDALQLMA